ncbi:hypothetical protein L13192_07589 [Pyrenophora tritici-repentis]|nr:hypothetical protein L13192_07589 [Pyrenophora tritici-repentis]
MPAAGGAKQQATRARAAGARASTRFMVARYFMLAKRG